VSLTAASTIANPVLLVRHAATSWTGRRWCGRADPPLTAAGQRAAHRLARDLRAELAVVGSGNSGSPPFVLLVSPARRARQTAAPIEASFGVQADLEPDLIEVDVGDAEGLAWPALETRFPSVAEAIGRGFQPDWPGGETRVDVERRASQAADRIWTAALHRPVLVVAHGAILHAITAQLVGDSAAISSLGPAEFLRLDPVVSR
jgi:ribonuclease H / adenosylcobalamin/alpha-ribazole phosphatase